MKTEPKQFMDRLARHLNLCLVALIAGLFLIGCGGSGSSGSTSPDSPTTGTGGSTARMTISGDYLYAIAGDSVQLFDISMPSSPNPYVNVRLNWNIETLFPYGDYLLVGAADALHIMDNTDAGRPELLTTMPHATAQDPVVAENDVAYLTLRDRTDSFQTFDVANELRVIDLMEISNPQLLDVIPMQYPSGLSIENNLLYICDGIAGIKAFDTSDPLELVTLAGIPGVVCNDLIVKDQRLYVITDDSIIQYDSSTLPPTLLSTVSRG